MPAIRFIYNGSFEVASPTHIGHSGSVLVRLHGGKVERFAIHGFICVHATKHFPHGSDAKVLASYITDDEEHQADDWYKLKDNEVVQGWRVQVESGGRLKWGVFIVVDALGFPAVVDDPNYIPPSMTRTATVHHLSALKSRASNKPDHSKT